MCNSSKMKKTYITTKQYCQKTLSNVMKQKLMDPACGPSFPVKEPNFGDIT